MTFCSAVRAAVLMVIVAAAGCTVTNSSSDGGSSSCKADSTVTSCKQGSGWSCDPTDTNSPADGNPLVCSRGVASSGSDKIDYCCVASTGVSSNCAEDSAVPCQQGTGFSCTGASTPDQSTLVCSSGTADKGKTDYCCIPYTQSTGTCMQDSAVTGCQSGSYGFSCVSSDGGTDTPQSADPSLTCSTGTPGNSGQTLYCCY